APPDMPRPPRRGPGAGPARPPPPPPPAWCRLPRGGGCGGAGRAPPPPAPPAAVAPQSAVIGGSVGPVGSAQEQNQLSQIVGGQASAATQLLLGPVVRGTTVNIAPEPGGDR
ncbi:mammalian cell entry protein, partial [Mycolicibacterium litorale]